MIWRHKTLILVLVIVAAVVSYIPVRAHFLSASFERVQIGDSASTVESEMGSRFVAVSDKTRFLDAPLEYQYYFWPNPQVWVVGFNGNVVVRKEVLVSP